MAPSFPNGVGALLESHENRLERVESGVQSCNTSLAECRVEITHINSSIHNGFAELGDKMDRTNDQHEALGAELSQLKPRLESLEARRRASIKRLSGIKSTILALALAGVGAVITVLAEGLLR